MIWTKGMTFMKMVYTNANILYNPVRIAAFDLDDTLIHVVKSNLTKCSIVNQSVFEKIKNLIDTNYIIVIFTNQSGMTKPTFNMDQWKKNVENLVKSITKHCDKYYVAIYVAKSNDIYRKPNIAMYNLMKDDLLDGYQFRNMRISVKSFYCGDAAGRSKASEVKKSIYGKSTKGDFSDSDYRFALNIGLKFITPDTFYIGSDKQTPTIKGFNPFDYLKNNLNMDRNAEDSESIFKPRKKELILMVGWPASGKSNYAQNYIVSQNYCRLNLDQIKSQKILLDKLDQLLKAGKSVVVDNTNLDVVTRYSYIALATKYKYKHIRAIIMTTSIDLAIHLNNVRHIYSDGTIAKIPDIVYNISKKKYIEPGIYEGFDKIDKVNMIINPTDRKWEKCFKIYS